MTYTLATRRNDGVSVIHDRNPIFVRLSDGALRNGYTIRILNKTHDAQSYLLKLSGLPDAEVEVIGSEGSSGGNPLIYVGPDQSREMRVLVTTHQKLEADASIPLTFTIAPADGRRGGERGRSFPRTVREQAMSDFTHDSIATDEMETGRPPRRWTGWTILFALLGFFGVIFAVNGRDDVRGAVDVERRRHRQRLSGRPDVRAGVAMAKAQDARHWRVDAKLTPSPDGERLDVNARDAAGSTARRHAGLG